MSAVDSQRELKLHILFESTFGHSPTGIWRAPGRVNLIGEHTDYNLGFVLPFAIDKNALVAVRPRTVGQSGAHTVRLATTYQQDRPLPVTEVDLNGLEPGSVTGWAAYPAAVVWALRQIVGEEVTGFDMLVDSNVPVGSGLSSSHALEVATAVALNELFVLRMTAPDLARLTQRAENEFVGAPTGIMDQSASLMGKAEHALFLDCRSLEAQAVPLPLETWDALVLVIDTRVEHSHTDGGYLARRQSCEAAAEQLQVASLREISSVQELEPLEGVTKRRATHIVTENRRVLDTVAALRAGDLDAVGALLCQSHVSMRDDYEISSVELDVAVDAAMAAGAIGARMTGGGFGGSAIALIRRDQLETVSSAVRHAFTQAGFAEPSIFSVSADDGAGRLV